MEDYRIYIVDVPSEKKSVEIMSQTDLYFEELGGGLYLCIKDNSNELIENKNLLVPREIRNALMMESKVGVYLRNSKKPSIVSNFEIEI